MENFNKIQRALIDIDNGLEFFAQSDRLNVRPTPLTELMQVSTIAKSWGHLVPYYDKENKTPVSPLSPISLYRDVYIAGRAKRCDIDVSNHVRHEKQGQTISKEHFLIEKIPNKDGFIAILTDESANGTFVNGMLVGLGRKRVLHNHDKISLSHRRWIVFTFRTFQRTKPNVTLTKRSLP